MMYCENCKKKIEKGDVCPDCGNTLAAAETAATTTTTEEVTSETKAADDFAEKVRETGSNFGQFFITLVKKPSTADETETENFIPALITLGIFSLILSFSFYFLIRSTAGIFMNISFFEHFFFPWISFIILLGAVASITFLALKIDEQIVDYKQTLAKYGAYAVPFLLLSVLGFIFVILNVGSLAIAVISLSLAGILFVIPTLIITKYSAQKYDQIFLLIGTYAAALLVSGGILRFILQSFIKSMIVGMFGGLF